MFFTSAVVQGGPCTVTAFKTIRARAEKRKGGPKALAKLLPARPDPKALARLGDDRILAEMTKRAFSAGFAWSVIESKWPGFEKAFLGFKPGPLSLKPDEFWDDLMKDEKTATRAVLALSARPKEAVALLREKMKPLTLTEDRARKLIAALGSEKDAEFDGTGTGGDRARDQTRQEM